MDDQPQQTQIEPKKYEPTFKMITPEKLEVTETKTEVKSYDQQFLRNQKTTLENTIAQAQKDLDNVNNLLANFI